MSKERAAQLIDAGIWLKLSGDLEGARRLFERALKLDPESSRAQELLNQGPADRTQPELPAVPPVDNPFERAPSSSPSAVDGDWGAATGATPSPVPWSAGEVIAPPVEPATAPERVQTMMMFSRSSPTLPFALAPSPQLVESDPPTDEWAAITEQNAVDEPDPEEAPAARQTLMFSGSAYAVPPGLVRVTPPPTPAEPARGPTGTLVFSQTPAPSIPPVGRGTLVFTQPSELAAGRSTMLFEAPSAVPAEVKPVVISLGGDDSDEEPRSIVDTLRSQVDQARGASARPPAPIVEAAPTPPMSASAFFDAPDPLSPHTVVLTDRAPEPTPPRVTPPMFSEAELPAVLRTTELASTQGELAVDDAWNWSSSPPPTDQPRPSPTLLPQASTAWDQRSNPGINLDDIAVPNSQALEFVSSSSRVTRGDAPSKAEEVAVLLRGARDLIDLDDHTGAMELITKAQTAAPDDPEVNALRERSEKTLLAMFESKLGHLEKIPRVLLKDDEIIWLNLDHRAGFVLAQIDGSVTFEDLFAVSGMSRLDTSRILAQLVDEGVISRG